MHSSSYDLPLSADSDPSNTVEMPSASPSGAAPSTGLTYGPVPCKTGRSQRSTTTAHLSQSAAPSGRIATLGSTASFSGPKTTSGDLSDPGIDPQRRVRSSRRRTRAGRTLRQCGTGPSRRKEAWLGAKPRTPPGTSLTRTDAGGRTTPDDDGYHDDVVCKQLFGSFHKSSCLAAMFLTFPVLVMFTWPRLTTTRVPALDFLLVQFFAR